MISFNDALAALDAPTGVLMLVWLLTQTWAIVMVVVAVPLRIFTFIFSL